MSLREISVTRYFRTYVQVVGDESSGCSFAAWKVHLIDMSSVMDGHQYHSVARPEDGIQVILSCPAPRTKNERICFSVFQRTHSACKLVFP